MKYPVSEKKCRGCSACCLVDRGFNYAPLPIEQQYYQCIAGAEYMCGEAEQEPAQEPQRKAGSYWYALMEGGGIRD